MATCVEQVDWSSCINPLLTLSSCSPCAKNVPLLIEAILKSEQELLSHDEQYEGFYSYFVALSTHYICYTVATLKKSGLNNVVSGCRVLFKFLLQKLQKQGDSSISQKHLMVLIKSLCKGSSSLAKSDIVTFIALLKSADIPPTVKEGQTGTAPETITEPRELKRPRLDTGRDLFSQMTSVFEDLAQHSKFKTDTPVETINSDGDTTIIHISDPGQEIKTLFANKNIVMLQQLNGGDVLLDVCTDLVYLRRYTARYEEARTGQVFELPQSISDAMSVRTTLQSVMNDVSIVWRVFSLPVLEPMTPTRLEKIVSVSMSCLYAAVTAAMATSIVTMATGTQMKGASSTKDEEIDGYAAAIVQKSLEIFSHVSAAIRTSTRAGGQNLQNFHMLVTWCLLKALDNLLTLTPVGIFEKVQSKDTSRSKSQQEPVVKGKDGSGSRPGSAKGHCMFGVLPVALSSQALTLLTSLMQDLQLENITTTAGSTTQTKQRAELSVFGTFTAQERMRRLTGCVNICELLTALLSAAYCKAASVKKPGGGRSSTGLMTSSTDPSSGDSSSSSDESNMDYEDDLSTGSLDNSSAEEDDDSEPILGQWFERTLCPEEPFRPVPTSPSVPEQDSETSANVSKHTERLDSTEGPSLLSEHKDPDTFLSLGAEILHFFNNHLLNTPDDEVKDYVRCSLRERHMLSVATVITDMDREPPKVDEVGIFEDFSESLARFSHSVVASGVLSEELQDALLTQLGVNPKGSDPWPLTVRPRSLAVLAEILLLRQQAEREAGGMVKSGTEAVIINVWKRFIERLQTVAVEFDNNTQDFEDLNVEHIQLLLFLFHSLPLMQKKLLFLQLAQSVVNVAEQLVSGPYDRLYAMIPLPLSRLLLIVDYLLHYFYDPPASLMDQVQFNLFGAFTKKSVFKDDVLHKRHFCCSEVEDSYMRHPLLQDVKDNFIKPRFYQLSSADYSNQDAPKIDGLACSFLLSTADLLNYNTFYEACINLLSAGCKADKCRDRNFSLLDACTVQYHFLVCWRLLSCLPPSVHYLHSLERSTSVPSRPTQVLHSLRWLPRLAHKAFQGWTKDYLVKQGMTTQKADILLANVVKLTSDVGYDVKMALTFIQDQIAVMPLVSAGEILSPMEEPGLCSVYMLDAVIAKLQVSLDELFTNSMADTDPHEAMKVAHDILPATFLLIEAYFVYIRSCLLHQVEASSDSACPLTPPALTAYGQVLSIGSGRASEVSRLTSNIKSWLPAPVRAVLDKWAGSTANEFPAVGAWRNAFANDVIPVESYIDAIQSAHLSTLSNQSSFSLNGSLKHMLQALVKFCADLIVWCPDQKTACSKDIVRVLFPMIFDTTTEYIADNVSSSVERVLGPADEEVFVAKTYHHLLSTCYSIIINHSSSNSGLDERILHDCLDFMESHLDKSAGKVALHKFFTEEANLVNVLLSAANENLSPTYGTKVLKFFNRLFQLAEKMATDKNYEGLCMSLSGIAHIESGLLQAWLSRMMMGSTQNLDEGGRVQENRLLLQSLTTYIVKENSHVGEGVAKAILNALIPMGSQILSPASEAIGFSELMVVMATLAGAGTGSGHAALFKAATGWLEMCKSYLAQKDVIEKLQDNVTSGKHQTMLESACYLLSYIGDILSALKMWTDRPGAASPPCDGDIHVQEIDSDWIDDIVPEEEDSAAEDSDDESLNNKLCTFSITQKEFMNQHWYHCHTCKMVDGMGVCSVCAKVCHKDHDLAYAKYGSFFCDCGAKEDSTCQALVKRSAQSGLDASQSRPHGLAASPFSMDTMLPSSLRRRLSSPTNPTPDKPAEPRKDSEKVAKVRQALCKQIESCRGALLDNLAQNKTVQVVLDLLHSLMPGIVENYQQVSPLGSTVRAQKTLNDLKTLPKKVESSDQLMTATLGSQEGAFENVRMNYSGDQGQTIRQLITSHVLRRVAMCCLSSPQGKRQHLAVSHEKGKVTILQLSALLKQADSSKRKLTLTRLASAPIPFTVLGIAGNPCNEDLLAVCGLKDCHVLTFSSTGTVQDHLVLHPSLETGNFIIKALWLPGSQTELAIVTADFVKIYNLSQDAISPQYYFLLPSGKIRDTTFVFVDEAHHLLIMSSTGYIYVQLMDEASSAQHGPFYITNILEVAHSDIKESDGQVAGGGVSVYYSHTLQLLFFSYSQGRNFAAGISRDMEVLSTVFPITFKSGNGGKAGSQALVQWTEVPNHPGLVCSMTQASNNPVIIMVKPGTFMVQEIKVVPAKAKIQDMVAIRHQASSSDQRTTLILLCEDGSLRIYMASVDHTSYWLAPSMQAQTAITVFKPTKKKKTAGKTGRPVGQVAFPVDFFEHCQHTNDVEFGGNDILQIYNMAQVKLRLNTTGMYVASTKTAGFNIEVTNSSSSTVIVGIRVLVGTQSLEKSPSYIELLGRTTQMTVLRTRWYDLPLTREESLTADKKLSIFFGASSDQSGVTMVDSIKIYVKTKEAFGWPEDQEDFPEPPASKLAVPSSGGSVGTSGMDSSVMLPMPLTSVDRLLASSLEVLDGCFATTPVTDDKDPVKQASLGIASQLLTLATPNSVQQPTKSLLASLFPTRHAYHNHKDAAQLAHVAQSLHCSQELGAEAFQRLVLTTRSVAVVRPANLVRFAESDQLQQPLEVTDLEADADSPVGDTVSSPLLKLEAGESKHFMAQLTRAFWKLLASRPVNLVIAPVCLPGLMHIDMTVAALVEIIHAFAASDLDNVGLATKLLVQLLLSEDTEVSFACKQTMIKVLRPTHRRRRVFIPSPPRSSTPAGGARADEDDDDDGDDNENKGSKSQPPPTPQEGLPPQPRAQQAEDNDPRYEVVEPPEPMVLEPPDVNMPMPQPSALEALLAGGANFPAMLDIPPDADDETMVELAIALSLQDQSGANGALSLQGLGLGHGHHHDHAQLNSLRQPGGLETGHLSDTTASAPGSDDEVGSTAATDGSTLRTSPAEHAGSAGSESGGSNVDSVSVSGRSSAYGENAPESLTTGARSETSSVGLPSTTGLQPEGDTYEQNETDMDNNYRLHSLRLMLLDKLIQYMPEVRLVGGVRTIPFMQVVLMLTSDLDSEEDKDKAALDSLLAALLGELRLTDTEQPATMSCRTLNYEVQLVIMRLLSVLMSRTKAGTKPSAESSSFVSTCAGSAMLQSGGLDYCLNILSSLLVFWKRTPPDQQEGSVLPGQLLKPHPISAPPDMSPFFLRQYVKGHANDVFEDYPQLLTEMVLRLPYQIKKISESGAPNVPTANFDQAWYQILAEYMMTQQAPFVRRQVRKLLLYICGSKEKYRQLRDMHTLEVHMTSVRDTCQEAGLHISEANTAPIILPYDVLISMIEHLKACSEVATTRTSNWQKFCQKDDSILPFLIQASIVLDEGVAPVLLLLLQSALCGSKALQSASSTGSTSPAKHKRDKDKQKDTEDKDKEKEREKSEEVEEAQKLEEVQCASLIQQVCKSVSRDLLARFVCCFLLESNATSVRWQAHTLVQHIYKNSSTQQQDSLLELMWSLWSELHTYGRKATQFVDLLGYFSLKAPQSSEKRCQQFVERAVTLLRAQNRVLATHPNGSIYNTLQGLADFDGYFLESDPCLVCNNPEVPYSNIKLSAIKVDSKFTTTTQIVKLVNSHTINKIVVRVSDVKRTKMVRTMNFYYNNRTVQAVVELKNKPGLWHKAKKVILTAGQTEVKVDFPLPIVACNLMIEYADFYDNLQGSTETLQCPRCSASVPANPGVCGNCGENVFQCHKCRAINYDEKDPFLCNACGFCKYAKFDFTLTAKPCCAVDPIESEEDRKKAVSTINTLLEKADRLYKQLQLNKPELEKLLVKISERGGSQEDVVSVGSHSASNAATGASSVNKSIQQLAQRYCGDCHNTFDELSKIIQRILASRKELVDYDRQKRESALAAAAALPGSAPSTPTVSPRGSDLFPKVKEVPPCEHKPKEKLSSCFGCASSTVEHCITLLRALATNTSLRHYLCQQGLVRDLVEYNLCRGQPGVRADVRQLLCLLSKNNPVSSDELNTLLTHRIVAAIKGHLSNQDFAASVRYEMLLLAATIQKEDNCWEQRIRTVMKLFLFGMKMRSPVVLESVALPCLRILHLIIKPQAATSKRNKEKSVESLCTLKTDTTGLHANAKLWINNDANASYRAWKHNMPAKAVDLTSSKKKKEKDEAASKDKDKDKDKEMRKRVVHVKYLMEKYGYRWQTKVHKKKTIPLKLADKSWLRQTTFSPSSRSARHTACNIMDVMCTSRTRKQEMLDLLSGYLDDVGKSGESAAEFLALYKKLICDDDWKYYLAIKGVLIKLGTLITKEIDALMVLEETTLNSDLSQGYALKALTELLVSFVDQERIKHHYKNRLVGTVLNGYLSLRKLVVQRTKLIDETQDKLLELLEEMTTGTDSETRQFMSVCVETVEKYPLRDFLSPVFIFERLCSIIFPEENDVGEFFLSLEKDPQQEDFLQGRMLGNPYSSNEPGLGPLMRDIKNKICQDCELVALLEDDTGMELLVCNKIISLDLPVKDVYKKIWSPDHSEGEPMRVVYRMRGLLGDATEDMVNSLDSGKDQDVDNEEVYKMAAVMSQCGGLRVMLQRLAAVRDLVMGRQLMSVLMKLFNYCVKVKANRQQLIKPHMNTISIMLGALNLALLAEQESGGATKGQTLTEQILQIMETILQEASCQSPDAYKEFSKLCGDCDQLMVLLDRINSPFVRANNNVLQALMRLIPFLAFGDRDKMYTLVNHFKPYLDYDKYDVEHTQDELIHLDCFCVIANGIENNANGSRLKDLLLEQGVVQDAVTYIQKYSPEIKTLLATDSENWKEFISKLGLPYVLRVLTGLAGGHETTQLLVGKEIIPILHKLEQVSSDEHVGTLAENLMEALREHPKVAEKVEDIRKQTRAEKKRLAMAKRKKQLGSLGMTTNEKGQVTVKSSVLKQMEDLKEETGLVCCICREGYRYQPTKVLGIYTYTKRANLDEGESKQPKSQGYSTVTHFNIIHVDCHLVAVRHARGREEWESAALQNANTRCNGLLPLWGPHVPESAFASCLARHNTYLQECTGVRDTTYGYTLHDLKNLLLKFSMERSFSEDSGGGGKESNIQLIPYLMHMVLYVLNTTRSVAREEKNLNNFLKATDKLVENCFEAEGPLYWTTMAVHIMNRDKWKEKRPGFVRRLLIQAQARHLAPGGTTSLADKAVKEYCVYKPYLLFFGLVDSIPGIIFKKCGPSTDGGSWPAVLAEYIRLNDQTLMEQCPKVLSTFQHELLPCESFQEFCDVTGLLEDIPDPEKFLRDALASLP